MLSWKISSLLEFSCRRLSRSLVVRYWNYMDPDGNSFIFDFLKTLPNLQTLDCHPTAFVSCRRQELPRLIASIRHAPLRELSFFFVGNPECCSLSVGCRLEKLRITWYIGDNPNSSLGHLYPLLRPSLTTLVELIISGPQSSQGLELLRPAGATLRRFTYILDDEDGRILDVIPEVFPGLSYLALGCRGDSAGIRPSRWKVVLSIGFCVTYGVLMNFFYRMPISSRSQKIFNLQNCIFGVISKSLQTIS